MMRSDHAAIYSLCMLCYKGHRVNGWVSLSVSVFAAVRTANQFHGLAPAQCTSETGHAMSRDRKRGCAGKNGRILLDMCVDGH